MRVTGRMSGARWRNGRDVVGGLQEPLDTRLFAAITPMSPCWEGSQARRHMASRGFRNPCGERPMFGLASNLGWDVQGDAEPRRSGRLSPAIVCRVV